MTTLPSPSLDPPSLPTTTPFSQKWCSRPHFHANPPLLMCHPCLPTPPPLSLPPPPPPPPPPLPHHLIFTERVFACAMVGAQPSPVSPPSPICTPCPLLVHPYCPICVEGAFACNPVFAWPLPPRPPFAHCPPPSMPPLPILLL